MTRDGKAAAETPADQELVQRVQKGETEAFGVLALRHQRSVYWVIQAILRNQADTEEILQETFVKAFEHIKDFRGEARFATWLIRIAINEARMRQRKYRPGLYESLDEDKSDQDDFRPRELSDWRPNPEEILAKGEIADLLRRAIQSLPSIYREVFLLRDVEHHSTEETASALGITVPAAKTRLLRARLMVREFLAPHFSFSPRHREASPETNPEHADKAQPRRAI
jgi:RNA polymerase sigma-70 factor (ECF subfamily)